VVFFSKQTIYYKGGNNMPKQSMKTIKIDKEAHRIIKEYCDQNGLKFAKFIEKVCVEYVEDKMNERR